MVIKTTCKKCGVTINLDFGDMTREEAVKMCEELDRTPRECPGMHCELGNWRYYWSLDDAIHRAYDLGEGESELNVPSDREHVEALLAEGREIYDGGQNNLPELGLPSIHSVQDLEHMGFGNFRNATHVFLRCDSPHGTRFYEKSPR